MKSVYFAFCLMIVSIIGIVVYTMNRDYYLDYTSLDFPPASTKSNQFIDSVLRTVNERRTNLFDKSLTFTTDRKKYKIGEEIELTVTNNTGETEYFYPSDEESARSLDLPINKRYEEAFKKSLVSKRDGIRGEVHYSDPCLIDLFLCGENSLVASKYGFEGFEKPLKSGEKLVFQIKLPERPGFYDFVLVRFSYDKKGIGYWGANRFIHSTIFEITNE